MNTPNRYYVYIMTNPTNTVYYTGVTNNLMRRISEHKSKLIKGFTKRYNVVKLVYFEEFQEVDLAIKREKQIKAGSRKKKKELIQRLNSEFNDVFDQL